MSRFLHGWRKYQWVLPPELHFLLEGPRLPLGNFTLFEKLWDFLLLSHLLYHFLKCLYFCLFCFRLLFLFFFLWAFHFFWIELKLWEVYLHSFRLSFLNSLLCFQLLLGNSSLFKCWNVVRGDEIFADIWVLSQNFCHPWDKILLLLVEP